MSKTKRLLSVTLASVMLFASAFSALAEDTATVEPLVGKIAAGEVTVELADTEVTEVTVPVTITFENKQTSPHGMFDISAEGATLKSATLVSFNNDNYVKDPNLSDEENIDKSVYLDADGINSANGRIIVESSTDESKKPATSEVKIDVVLEFATALKADRVIDVVIDGIQATNFSEAPWTGMEAVNGTITVKADVTHEAAADWSYDDTNHWHACVVEGCTEHIGENAYDYAEHSYDAGVVTDPTTTSKGYTTYTCECGYSYTDNEVDELAVAFVPYYDPTASTLRVHYEYPADSSALMKTKLAYAKAQGNRKIEYILTIEGKDYSFEMDKISSGWFIQVANFGIHDTYLDAEICIKISWGGEDPGSWTTNSLDFNISKLVAAGKIEDTSNSATDTIVALSDDIINAYNAMITEYEKLSETDYIVMSSGVSTEEGYISYAVNYYPKSTDIQITYTYGDDFKNDVLTPAKGQGTDKRAISYKMSVCDSDPYVFEMTKISSGLYVQPAGFTIHDLDNIKVWLHVEGYDTDNTEVVHDTNAVTLNINEGIATDSSAFAVAYTAFMKLI